MLWVEDAGVLGERFALLEWISGQTLAERIRTRGWHSDGRTIGLLLARLHSLSPEEFPAEAAPGALMPALNEIAGLIGPARFDAVREWFDGHRVSPRTLSVCHLGLHPLNVVMSRHEPTVIDWEMARIDDPLLDVAMAQVHVEVSLGWGELPWMEDRFAYGRSVSAAYRAFRSVPEADLRYYRVLAACRRPGDVAGARERADMPDEVRVELQVEGTSAIGILDREIDFAG